MKNINQVKALLCGFNAANASELEIEQFCALLESTMKMEEIPSVEVTSEAEHYDVEIYTDGACSGNPGPGGWAAVLSCAKGRKEISGAEESTTNNRMEMLSIISAIECLKKPGNVVIYSDSAYVVNNFERIETWKSHNWRGSTGREVMNKDLWQRMEAAVSQKTKSVAFKKVPGHAGVELNERCDELARAAILNLQKESK